MTGDADADARQVEALERAFAGQTPGCIDGRFVAVELPHQRLDHCHVRRYAIACAACGKDRFQHDLVRQGDSEVGILLRCIGCADERMLFDGEIHGYDGALGQTGYRRGARTTEHRTDPRGERQMLAEPVVRFFYNIPHAELADIAASAGVAAIDLFDWFDLAGTVDGERQDLWGFEAA